MQDKYRDISSRKKEVAPLEEAFEELLKTYRLKDTFDQKKLIQEWPELMGKTVASRTSSLFIKEKKLFVKINSGPVKQELSMNRSKVLDIIEKRFGKKVVEEIVFL
jgi:predicted nucleic acid-binding Zn ribbon protein